MADETAPVNLKMTADGDINLDPVTGISFASGIEAVTNAINAAVELFEGEWFADLEAGIPYYQDILGEKYDEATIVALFRAQIFEVPNVESIQRLSSNFNRQTRTLTVYFEIITAFGQVTDTVEI